MPHHTDKPETQHPKKRWCKMTLERENMKLDDDMVVLHPHVDGLHEVIVESQKHHLENIKASNEFLKLLNFHHGLSKGFSEGHSNL